MLRKFISLLLILIFSFSLLADSKEDLKEVYNEINNFIKNNPDSPLLAEAYFNFAEVNELLHPVDYKKNAQLYEKVISINSNFTDKDVVLYNIGFNLFQHRLDTRDEKRAEFRNRSSELQYPDSLRLSVSNLEKAINAFEEIRTNYKNSEYWNSAVLYLGRIYFNLGTDNPGKEEYFEKAIKYFGELANVKNIEDSNRGLFYRGWVYLMNGRYEESIDDFAKILENYDKYNLEERKLFLKEDSIDNIAFSISEFDGIDYESKSEAAEKAENIFLPVMDEDFGKKVIREIIDLKHQYNAPMQAVDFYNTYISLYNESKEIPTIVDSIITIYRRNPSRLRNNKKLSEGLKQQYERILNNYNASSDWYNANKNKDIEEELEILNRAYKYLEPRYYENYRNSGSWEDLNQYYYLVDKYREFDVFSDSADIAFEKNILQRKADITLNFAEINEKYPYYLKSVAIYKELNQNFENVDENFENEKKIYYATNKYYDYYVPLTENESFKDSVNKQVFNKSQLDNLYIKVSKRFQNVLENKNLESEQILEQYVSVVLKRANLYYKNKNYNLATQDYNLLLNYPLNDERKKIIYTNLANINSQKGNFVKSEELYRKASQYAKANESDLYQNNIIGSMVNNAKEKGRAGSYLNSAREYIRLANEFENIDEIKYIGSLRKAIDMYKKASQYKEIYPLYKKIASLKNEKRRKLNEYILAWNLADSLNNHDKVIELKREFISKYPQSQEAYQLRLDIIKIYENEPYNDLEKAAQMYLALYEDSKEMNLEDVKTESLILKAIKTYQEMGEKEKEIEQMLRFEKLYPKHPKSDDFLVYVASHYQDSGQKQKFENLAEYIYKKNPDSNLLVRIAVSKLKKTYGKITSAFKDKNYSLMQDRIDKFKEIDDKYRSMKLNLDLNNYYEEFEYYQNYVDYYERLNSRINDISRFLERSPQQIIKVNNLTTWKNHLNGGPNRIKRLQNTVEVFDNNLMEMYNNGDRFRLPAKKKTQILYLIAKGYEYASEVYLKQITKYANISNELNPTNVQDEETLNKYRNYFKKKANNFRSEYFNKALNYYFSIYKQFYLNKNVNNKYSDASRKILLENNIIEPLVEDKILFDSRWKINKTDINNDLKGTWNVDLIWDNVNIENQTIGDTIKNVMMIKPNEFPVFVKNSFDLEIEPEQVVLDYIYEKPLQLVVNDSLIGAAFFKNEMGIKNKQYNKYAVSLGEYVNRGTNNIAVKLATNIDSTKIFRSSITKFYNKEKLEEERSKINKKIKSNMSWLYSSDPNAPDSLWNFTNEITDYTANDSLLNKFTDPIAIWIDNEAMERDTLFSFKKELEINDQVLDADIKILSEANTKIEINNKEVTLKDSSNIYKRAKISNLTKGINEIKIKCIPNEKSKYIIIELNLTLKPIKEANNE